ncbi:MAG: hypothetical protein LBS50_00280 [Prevotellaceae bacterium]|jgi:hypothetical protein|nr:hypothetical protein [Prevotellaceae bacterium]
MFRKILFIITFSLFFVGSRAQENGVKNFWTAGYGNFYLRDSYLSELDYLGWNVMWEARHSAFFKKAQNFRWKNENSFSYGYTINRPATAVIMYLSGDFGFGTSYNHLICKGLTFNYGGYLSLFAAGKYNGRNVNNIASTDVNLLLNADFSAEYRLKFKKMHLVFGDNFQIPVVGAMFVPEMGALYYEYSLGNWQNSFHFSSFHNRFGIKNRANIDLEFRKITLRLQAMQNFQKWSANNLNFSILQYTFGAGIVVYLENVTKKNFSENF